MYFVAAVLPLFWMIWTANGVGGPPTSTRHSLFYIYTAFSKPVSLPGIHEFTAMGLLDGRLIDYFDNDLQQKVPKQLWMKQRLPEDYWKKGTVSRKNKQQWFKVNLDILDHRINHSNTDNHVLQWMHGCEVKKMDDGSTKFVRGLDQYNYDGADFLAFDDSNKRWVAGVHEAHQTKNKWDTVDALNDYTQSYLENECVEWLDKFLVYSQQELQNASLPQVFVFAKTPRYNKNNLLLTCMATGFYPKDITLNLRLNQQVLDKEHGVTSTGVRPNGDGTHQITKSVEILKSDSQCNYTCEVIHLASEMYVIKMWDHHVHGDDGDVNIGLVVGVVVSLPLLLLLLWLVHRLVLAMCPARWLECCWKRMKSEKSLPYIYGPAPQVFLAVPCTPSKGFPDIVS